MSENIENKISEPTQLEDRLGQKIWQFMKLNHKLRKADAIIGLGSSDMIPAEIAANLILKV